MLADLPWFSSLQLGLVLDSFATYEVLLFATLAARKLGASHLAVRALLAAGLTLHAGAHVQPWGMGSVAQHCCCRAILPLYLCVLYCSCSCSCSCP